MKGQCAVRDEAAWHLRAKPEPYTEFVEKLAALASHSERAMVTFLDYPDFWEGATMFYRAGTMPYWRKRKGLPHEPASVHEDGRRALADGISDYFHRTEGRESCLRLGTPVSHPLSTWSTTATPAL